MKAFEAEERLLSAERRALAVEALEERFERLDKLRLSAVRRLLRLPAADLPALVLKLDLAVAEQAWEDSGSEDCVTVIAADARRISRNAVSLEPANGVETMPRDSAEFLDSPEAILAYLKAVFEDGDPEPIALALNDLARAKGLAQGALTAQSDIASVVATLKALGLELTAKAA